MGSKTGNISVSKTRCSRKSSSFLSLSPWLLPGTPRRSPGRRWRSLKVSHGPRGGRLLVHSRDTAGGEAQQRHDDLLRGRGGGGGGGDASWQEEGRREKV